MELGTVVFWILTSAFTFLLGLLFFLIKKLYDSVVSTFAKIHSRLDAHYKSILDLGFSRDMFKRDILELKKGYNELENKMIKIETSINIKN
jgi:hypothetical protein